MTADPTRAERQRRWRQRRAAGVQVVPVHVDQEVIDRLLALRLVSLDDIGDAEQIAAALAHAVKNFL